MTLFCRHYRAGLMCCFRCGFRTVAPNTVNKRSSWSSRCRQRVLCCRRHVTAWCEACTPAVPPCRRVDRATRTAATRRCRAIRRWSPIVRRLRSLRRWVAWLLEGHYTERPVRRWCLAAAASLDQLVWPDTDLPQRSVQWPEQATSVRLPYLDLPPWEWTTTLTWSVTSSHMPNTTSQ